MRHSTLYTLCFAAAVCLVCSVLVTTSAVSLADRQAENELLYKRRNVLMAAGLLQPGEKLSPEDITARFETVVPKVVDLETDAIAEDVDATTFDLEAEPMDTAPPNRAQIQRIPKRVLIYQLMADGEVDMLILPVYGKGLWSTLRGFLALDAKTYTIRGITFYEHAETPGLGGEIDNPRWKALWEGRTAFDEDMNPIIEVVKGKAQAAHQVDGLAGATLTSRGVSNLVRFWLGGDGFGPFLKSFRRNRSRSAEPVKTALLAPSRKKRDSPCSRTHEDSPFFAQAFALLFVKTPETVTFRQGAGGG